MIYYTSSTGTIIGGTSATSQSQLQNITHIPSGCDYAIYVDDTTVSSLNPSNQPGTYSFTGVTAGATYTVPTATGTLQFTALSQAQQLTNAQAAQINLLRQGYTQTIASGFQYTFNTATPTTVTFGWSTDDKTNLLAVQESIDDGFLTFPILYTDKYGNPVTIPDQATLTSIKSKASAFFANQHQQILSLISQVQSATSVSAVQAIVWTSATY